jgi:D-amino-acid dehydrogenase
VTRPRAQDGEVWGGMRPVTPDGMPYVGRFRRVQNLIAATGHAMIGVSLAPVTGKIVSELVCGTSERELALLSPDRFD